MSRRQPTFTRTDTLFPYTALFPTLQAAPGGQGTDLPIADRVPDAPSLWDSVENQRRTVALWRKLAARYARTVGRGLRHAQRAQLGFRRRGRRAWLQGATQCPADGAAQAHHERDPFGRPAASDCDRG